MATTAEYPMAEQGNAAAIGAQSPKIPGPKTHPVLGWRGNFLQYFRNPIRYMTHLRDTYGDVAALTSGRNKPLLLRPEPANCFTVFGFGAECNREILSRSDVFQKRRPRGPNTKTIELLVNNVAMVTSDKQKRQRRQMMPAFSRQHLENFYEPMVATTSEYLDGWQESSEIMLFDETLALIANIAVRCVYGVDLEDEYGSLAILMRDLNDVVFNPLAMIPVNLPGTPYRKGIDIGNKVRAAVTAEIARKRAAGAQGTDLLSMMVREADKDPDLMTEEELVGNAYIMFFAGYETSSLALAWALFLLAQHPQIMADLMDELDSEVDGGPPTFQQIYELPMLDRVIRESLRLLGPTVAFPRFAAEATTLGGYEIPVGAEVMYSPYMTHVDSDLYPEPKRFHPDRWLGIKRTAYEYLPFGAGARSCMGTAYASMLIRIALPMIVQRYRLQVLPRCEMNIEAHTQMRPKNGLPVIVHRQDRKFARSHSKVRGDICDMVDFG